MSVPYQHTQGRVFFSASWHRHTGARLFCVWSWLCVSPGLVEGALPALWCSHRGCGPETSLACLSSFSWARSMPLGSGTVAEFWRGLWSGEYVGSMAYTAPRSACLCCHPRAGEWGCPGPGDHPANGCHHVLWLHSCLSLTPLPFTGRKYVQQINTRAAGVPSASEPKCTMKLHPSVMVFYTPA